MINYLLLLCLSIELSMEWENFLVLYNCIEGDPKNGVA
jgi:hypothetical protein